MTLENKESKIASLQQILDQEPNDYKTMTEIGILFMEIDECDKGCAMLVKALKSSNNLYPPALNAMGELLISIDRP